MIRGPVATAIRKKLAETFKPVHLEVVNESHMHNWPTESERYFKVVVISETFKGKSLVQRHRAINDILSSELETTVHALSIVAQTPIQWDNERGIIPKSPPCRGGSRKA